MTLEGFKKKAETVENYNTTNGWGFGGRFGKVYTHSSGLKFYNLKYQHRHQGNWADNDFYNKEEKVTKEEFLKLINNI